MSLHHTKYPSCSQSRKWVPNMSLNWILYLTVSQMRKRHQSISHVHMYKSITQRDYSCITTSYLRQHMLRHSGERHSDVCSVTILALKLVIWRGISSDILGEKRIACKQCSYSCRYSGGMNYHMLSHTGEKTFACKKCNFSCTIASRLNPHMLIDSGEKPSSCTQCDYSCLTACVLKKHILTH